MNTFKSQITANTVETVKAQVLDLMERYGYNTFSSKEEISEYYNKAYEYGPEWELHSEIAESFEVPGEVEDGYEWTITVTIKAFYKDSGASNYCYLVEVDEN
jgi:hypothetical protein